MRATIGISSGDPAGIGLEVALKALPGFVGSARWVVFTDRPVFDAHYRLFGRNLPVRWVQKLEELSDESVVFLMEVPGGTHDISWGQASGRSGQRALAYLQAASDAATGGKLQGIVTAPVSKAAIGADFKGQTEFLAEDARIAEFAMAFVTPTFKVVLATVHVSLREALDRISTSGYVRLIQFTVREFSRLGFPNPRIAVAGVNPHAGEGGMFGREEIEVLQPAIDQCAAMGLCVSGPHSPDSLYHRAHSGEFDVVIAPYHDQGLIPVKLIAHGNSVNVTLGLPYVRTSPDHGTAFSIAGKDVADPSGMTAAMRLAVKLVDLH